MRAVLVDWMVSKSKCENATLGELYNQSVKGKYSPIRNLYLQFLFASGGFVKGF